MSSFVFYPTDIYWQAACDIASLATLIQEFMKSAVKGNIQSPEDYWIYTEHSKKQTKQTNGKILTLKEL